MNLHWLGLALLMFLWLLAGCTIPPLDPHSGPTAPVTDTQTVSTVTPTPLPTITPALDNTCNYAVVIRDAETSTPIENAKITLEYQLDALLGYTDSEGRYCDIFFCDEEAPRYRLRVEADDYQTYSAEFTLMEKPEEIYLFSRATPFCNYIISVLDEANKGSIADAKVRIEYSPDYTPTGYTNSDGLYHFLFLPESVVAVIWPKISLLCIVQAKKESDDVRRDYNRVKNENCRYRE